jgi:yecA family protein
MMLEVNEDLIGFDVIANLLVSENVFIVSPAELHGLLAGQLASGARMVPDMWLKTVSELLEIDGLVQETSKVGLIGLYQQALKQLESFGLEFSMLLPDDDATLEQRVESLGRWCQGFMTGFGYQGKQTDKSLSDEAKDVLRDLSQISQIANEVDEGEDSEADLMELEEYVRMAVLMLFAECNVSHESFSADNAPQVH